MVDAVVFSMLVVMGVLCLKILDQLKCREGPNILDSLSG